MVTGILAKLLIDEPEMLFHERNRARVDAAQVEVLLEEGTRLIVLREPFGPAPSDGPGGVRLAPGDVELLPERERRTVTVRNAGRRPVRISSHFPFWLANPSLEFDRDSARGFRLDLPAGDSLRWAPGEEREVDVGGHAVRVKVTAGRVKVEFDDAERAAAALGLPLRTVLHRAEAAATVVDAQTTVPEG